MSSDVPDHRHCLECDCVIPSFLRYCARCDQRLKEAARVRELIG